MLGVRKKFSKVVKITLYINYKKHVLMTTPSIFKNSLILYKFFSVLTSIFECLITNSQFFQILVLCSFLLVSMIACSLRKTLLNQQVIDFKLLIQCILNT